MKLTAPKSTEELKERYPEAYDALPSCYKDECLTYFVTDNVLRANHKWYDETMKYDEGRKIWFVQELQNNGEYDWAPF